MGLQPRKHAVQRGAADSHQDFGVGEPALAGVAFQTDPAEVVVVPDVDGQFVGRSEHDRREIACRDVQDGQIGERVGSDEVGVVEGEVLHGVQRALGDVVGDSMAGPLDGEEVDAHVAHDGDGSFGAVGRTSWPEATTMTHGSEIVYEAVAEALAEEELPESG